MELHSESKTSADERGLVYLMNKIDAKSAEETIKRIVELNLKGVDSIQLIVNSPGGRASSPTRSRNL